jgi:hypothetical protein
MPPQPREPARTDYGILARPREPEPARSNARPATAASNARASFVATPTPAATTPGGALRAAPAETQSQPQLKAQPAERDDTFEPDAFAQPQIISRPQPRAAIKAYGLDTEPPPEQRPAALARSRVALAAAELEPPPPRTLASPATLWSAGTVALVLFLAVQVLHHYRNDLAATAQFNKPITALYTALGMRLTPHWDLHAYDVRQLGASVDSASAGQIMVRASVKNGARQAQPMPLLRVTLQDRFGNRIAARDVSPGSYLPRAIPEASFLSAGQRIDAEMAFVDPGSNAVGFEIDACLPAPAGGIACANDSTSR